MQALETEPHAKCTKDAKNAIIRIVIKNACHALFHLFGQPWTCHSGIFHDPLQLKNYGEQGLQYLLSQP